MGCEAECLSLSVKLGLFVDSSTHSTSFMVSSAALLLLVVEADLVDYYILGESRDADYGGFSARDGALQGSLAATGLNYIDKLLLGETL